MHALDVTEQVLFCLLFDELFNLLSDCSQNNRPGLCKGPGSRKFMHFICWNITIFGKMGEAGG